MSDTFSYEDSYEQTGETIGSMVFRTQTEFTEFMNNYDFRSALRHIMDTNETTISFEDDDRPYENRLYGVLGDICISGSEKDVNNITWKLINPYGTAQAQLQGSNDQIQLSKMVTGHTRQEDSKPLAAYTSALYEQGQLKGIQPQKEVKQFAFDPPEFKVIIHFGYDRGFGTGRNKKHAGHLAAKDLCQQLGIVP